MIIVAGWIATDIWRWIGVFAGGKLREDSELLIWVRAVATALVAGVIAKLILFPTGALEVTPVWLRFLAALGGFAAFFTSRQKVAVGVVSGEIILIAGWLLLEAV
ncbi:AzlD domain-containing protein [uncultured Roseibium sp.]|uniref:AzlD domain-containing protein n=1 Tax=uncultured Roseibium sp. TaxID=1936171 RepID=UPI002593C5E9|nr:AzlD domain-containing protein [uncultured Roseibium sp.]